MLLTLLTTTSDSSAVDGTARALGPLVAGQTYEFATTANCWIRQGTNQRITCVTKASLVDGDTLVIGVPGSGTKTYEFDVTGDGVVAGRVRVNVSTDTTAAQVAARLKTAIDANQLTVTTTDNGDGTLDLLYLDGIVVVTEHVANAGFTVTSIVMPVSAADSSMLVPLGRFPRLNGDSGLQIGVKQDGASTGNCTITRAQRF